jgi:hypothetical protein
MIAFNGRDDSNIMYDELVRNECDIIGVNNVLGEECSCIFRRTKTRQKFTINGVRNITGYYTAKSKCTRDFNSQIVKALLAWQTIGPQAYINFDITPFVEMTSEILMKQWQDMDKAACQWEIIEAKEKCSIKGKDPSERDKLINKMGGDVLRRKLDMASGSRSISYQYMANSIKLINLEDFINVGAPSISWKY